MNFLLDQDVFAVTSRFLKELKHDVITVSDINMSRASDIILLKKSQEQQRIFITRDRDFGGLVFVEELGCGVIYLRVLPSTIISVHKEIETVLTSYSEDDLKSAFVVIEPARHRFRRIKENHDKIL
ncbi:MAG: DUF5615 family PIN-like protein [Nitrospirae bacterium]|uniref:DUF5615 family PIN-like protein n=1 Tax=Candidatus Magnetobacterium casense TaxID=1455061 RepID=UPI00058D5DA3|nr:DUF5615 family PIN-like protein [Candidatus Magnetobacterium casensis]MBF0336520.1 DUF5615 family PIN-like protein [Nitrospirota bacterium]